MRPVFVLAHGAGAGHEHPFLRAWAERLASLGPVLPVTYPYRAEGRRAPDRLPRLLLAHEEAAHAAQAAHPDRALVLVGKSLGGRVGCHLHAARRDLPVRALVCLGFPLKGGKGLRDAVLRELRAPTLFVQGDRDPLAPLPLLRPALAAMGARHALHVVRGGDHSLALRRVDERALGISQTEADAAAFAAVDAFLAELA